MITVYFDDLYVEQVGNIQTAMMKDKLVCIAVNKTVNEVLNKKFIVSAVKDISLNKKIIQELKGYFAGESKSFSVPYNFLFGTDFQKKIWAELTKIQYGKTITYGELANRTGNSNASRAVGNANSKNPIPIVIPCHRVIASNGAPGGFSCGLDIKKYLLDLEILKRNPKLDR